MPEFVMEGRDHAARELDSFTLGYIEALFFTETSPAFDSEDWHSSECREAQEEGTVDGSIPGDCGFCDLAPDTLERIKTDCAKFQEVNRETLESAYATGYDESQAGRDFWYTRNGHGVGFWDRDLGDIGDTLDAACGWRTEFPEVDVYFGDDSRVHVS